ncbi:MAG: hypothetical protein A2075_16980 [Geobacteraceae bacterium GWC2_58_44]|nr:MAG: hypothetical protein A2075_16980 [Geobacteraceae bacterium GWC2_58_44]
MKKVLAIITAVGCLSAAATALAGVAAGTGVNGSLHDMTKITGANVDIMGRVCVYCHTPHHAVVTDGTANLPLWNHNLTPDDQFTAYTWATPNNSNDGAFDILDPLAGPSRLCMSCHDGSIGVDQHGSAFAQAGNKMIGTVWQGIDYTGRADLTKDLSNTHPIGFDYNDIAAFRNSKAHNGEGGDTEIVSSDRGYATAITISEAQGVYNKVTRNNGTNSKLIADNLYGGSIMTCATCHEVHNKENATQDNYLDGRSINVLNQAQKAPNYFLYARQTESLICLSCHIK